jgi:hypothetical protein
MTSIDRVANPPLQLICYAHHTAAPRRVWLSYFRWKEHLRGTSRLALAAPARSEFTGARHE